MKILIADDSGFARAVLRDIVLKSKWKDAQILEAADGAAAVAMYQAERPELVLLDVIMPERNGIEVLQDIGSSAQAVVIVSSVEEQQVMDQAKQLGAKSYITKPYDAQKVIEVLNGLSPNQGQ